MKTKKVALLLAFFLLNALYASAQQYWVYSVSGSVKDNAEQTVKPKSTLQASSLLNLGANARITLVDEGKSTLHTIKGAAKGKLKDLLTQKTTSAKAVTPQYIALLKKKLNASSGQRSTTMQSTAAAYRDVDSLIIASDSID